MPEGQHLTDQLAIELSVARQGTSLGGKQQPVGLPCEILRLDDQPVSAVDAMLAGLRFVRQGERARLEIGNLGRFALHAATRRVAALGMGDGADLGAIYEAACFLQSQCCTAQYCACSEAALFCALQVYQPPPEGCQAPDLRRVFVETAIPEAAMVVCANCQSARWKGGALKRGPG